MPNDLGDMMANWINHKTARKRTFEYCRLNLHDLAHFYSYPTGKTFALEWKHRGEKYLEIVFKRQADGLFIHTHTGANYGYHIAFEKTLVTFGVRHWYQCPVCKKRAGVLFHSHGTFACRHCVKPAYESQNGYKQNYIGRQIRAERKKLWGDSIWADCHNLLESCYWWPKPKNIHLARFEREKNKILEMEESYRQLVPSNLRSLVLER